MHSNDTTAADRGVETELRQSFPVLERPVLLPGGERRTYRAGAYVYRRETRPAEATYVAELYADLVADGFRIPQPIRSFQGGWLTPTGWSGWTYVDGHPALAADADAVIPAIAALHRTLADRPYPAFLRTKDTPYTRAEQAAWGTIPADVDEDIAPLVRLLVERRLALPNPPEQLIHIDLNDTNILVAPGMLPAFVDFTPGWRPAGYATAVFAYWLGVYRGHLSVLQRCAMVPAFDQLLLRVSLSKLLLVHELRRIGAGPTSIGEWMTVPVERVIAWLDRRRGD